MKITFYTKTEQYPNRVTDKEVLGVVKDITFNQLVYSFKIPKQIELTLDELNTLGTSENEADRFRFLSIKDQGFFIGGEVNVSTMRKSLDSIVNRTLITLDIDKPKHNEDGSIEDVWQKFKSAFPNTQAIRYSTIRNTKENPRYRIVIPLSRQLLSRDFTLVSKYLANLLGRENFDKTTHDYSRVMFLPTVCKDSIYEFEYQGTSPLQVDLLLAEAQKHIEELAPSTSKEKEYKNPLDKAGIVGAFNRVYSITDAIDNFLLDVYSPAMNFDKNNPRYRYKLADAKSLPGARVYDNNTLFYSAHDTDPAVGKQLDAFNLVKLHKFNDNFLEMKEFSNNIPEVQEELHKNSRLVDTPEEWKNLLILDKNANIKDTMFNLQLIFLNDKGLDMLFRLNTLTFMIEVNRDMAEAIDGARDRKGRSLEDADLTDVRIYLETCETPIKTSKQNVVDMIASVARLNKYHPVKEYLESLQDSWDGVKRVDTIFTDYLMVKDTPIMRAMARKVLAAAVHRVFVPGIKWEGVPVIWGLQDSGKSTFIQKLYKSSPYDKDVQNWVNNTAIDYSNMDKAIERTKHFWGIELAELASNTMSNFSNEQMKAFISADRPVTRIPYDRFPLTFDRTQIFWGTTNTWLYISDQTGARRFLPIDCGSETETEKFECLRRINNMPVDMIWAEVMTYYKDEPLFFTIEQREALNQLRLAHTEESTFETILSKFVTSKIPMNWDDKSPMERRDYFITGGVPREDIYDRKYITLSEIAYEALGKPLSDLNRKQVREIETTMFNIGWVVASYRIKSIYGESKTFISRKGGAKSYAQQD